MKIILLTLLSFFPLLSLASPTPPEIQKSLKTHFSELNITDVSPTSIPHLYRVTSGPLVLYLSEDGRYAIQGDMVDLKTQQNITEQERKTALRATLKTWRQEGKIKLVYPAAKPHYTITVFTDVDCGYCRKFHQHIDDLNTKGITVEYLAFPRSPEGSDSYQTMISVWCSDNPTETLTAAKKGQNVTHKNCKHPLSMHTELGLLAGVRGTPAIILPDGSIVPGYMPPSKLLSLLQKIEKEGAL